MVEANETLDLNGVAALLIAEPETVVQYARTGELPGTRVGKGWIFLREDVLGFLRQRIDRDTEMRRLAHADAIAKKNQPKARSTPGVLGVLAAPRKKTRRTQLPQLPALTALPVPSP